MSTMSTDPSTSLQSLQLSVDQAANFAGVSSRTIRRWLETRRLAGTPHGNTFRIDQADLEYAMEHPEGLPEEEPPPPPVLARTDQLASSFAQAMQSVVISPLYDRLEQQAQRIGQLEAELTAATAPKPARRRSDKPRAPRLSVAADDPNAALRKLAQHYGAAELARLVRRLKE